MRENTIKWTPENVEMLRDLAGSGLSAEDIAERMGATKWSIQKASLKFAVGTQVKRLRVDFRCDQAWALALSMPRPKSLLND